MIRRAKTVFVIGMITFFACLFLLLFFEIYLMETQTRVLPLGTDGIPARLENDAELLVNYTPRGRRLVPSARVLIKNHRISGRDVAMEINSLGFRDGELRGGKDPDDLRILVLGDSITWAGYLPELLYWPKKISRTISPCPRILSGDRKKCSCSLYMVTVW